MDISDKNMFDYLANTYGIGNFETPGIFATQGEILYFRNYERYEGPESFKRIGPEFLKKLDKKAISPMSNRGIIDFFTVNLLNFEYCINFPIKTFLVMNGFLASMMIPLLLFDTFYKPLLGYGPT